jgi:tetratricopeptide (TPR) repeat protein
LQKSDVQDKELILRVLSMHSDPVVREKEIKNMSEAFEVLKDDILPKLRRSKILVNVNVVGFSDEEILKYFETNPDTLGLEELLYTATLVEDTELQLKAYHLASIEAPKCFRAVNGAGYTLMKMGKVEEAKAAFEKAQELYKGDYAKNNLGFCALIEGDLEKAQEYFTSMEKATDESNFGLGTISLFQNKYQDAENFFGTKASFNSALAKLLNGNTTGAKNTLEAIDHECPPKEYLLAVVSARMDNEQDVFNHLKAAVALNEKVKGLAKTDMEFGKYFENETFKSIVE